MKNVVIPALLVLTLASLGSRPSLAETPPTSSAQTPAAQAIVGKWKKVGKEGVVEVSGSGGVFTGTLTKSDKKDFVGKVLFRELTFDAEKNHYNGKIYAPKRNKEYKATWTVAGNEMTLKVKSRKIKWTRL